ncbi:MAG: transporter substrate-binding domain-containing protein [Myxococcales bacterium]|nr:transporter substrate-binding domain-containing protein [Myxococcales bacterium]
MLRVGTSGDYAPFSHHGNGFDIEVAHRMARDLGYRIEWVTFGWSELSKAVADNKFAVAMSGITWTPDRSVAGWMTRAIGVGGPCVLRWNGGQTPGKIGVNRGGILERWTRKHYPPQRILTVDNNLSLPQLLSDRAVSAIVTDRFEVEHFSRPGWQRICEPARQRKVYWVTPAYAAELGPRMDTWLEKNEGLVANLRQQYFGAATQWTAVDHLIDLMTRRLALMPLVAAYKRTHRLPIEDRAREAVVLQQVLASAKEHQLPRTSTEQFFRLQIQLAKIVQIRAPEPEAIIDLQTILRPALSALGPRILDALVLAQPALSALRIEQLDLLSPLLTPNEQRELLEALRLMAPVSTKPG